MSTSLKQALVEINKGVDNALVFDFLTNYLDNGLLAGNSEKEMLLKLVSSLNNQHKEMKSLYLTEFNKNKGV